MKTLLLITFLAFGTSVFAQDNITKTIDDGLKDINEVIVFAQYKNELKEAQREFSEKSKLIAEKKYSALKRIVTFVPNKEEEIIIVASKG